MGQVWYLMVSIPDLCILTYFVAILGNVDRLHEIPYRKVSKNYQEMPQYILHVYLTVVGVVSK